MALKAAPTKGNLIAAKNSLKLAKQGYELMDKKRNILIRELMELIEKAKEVQGEIDKTFRFAYACLENANEEMGITTVEDIAQTIPIDDGISLKVRSIMGTEIPYITHDEQEKMPTYSFYDSRESFDKARESFVRVKELTIKLAMIENSAYRLAMNIKKTQKRANALQNITIPTTESVIRTITDALEEKEREDFIRLKVIKREMEKKNNSENI